MMIRSDPTSGDAPRRDRRRVSKPAVIAASVALGALLVWAMVRPLAPQVADAVLMGRYAWFCASHGILFCVCEWIPAPGRMPLSPLIGPTAAAVTASMYLQVFGVPSEMLLLLVLCLSLGFFGCSCLWAPKESEWFAVSRLLDSLSLATVLFSAAVLPAAVLNLLLAGGPASSGVF